jgi:PAS domain S-box-containing protein
MKAFETIPKILIVDDNPENLFVLEKILKKLSAEVVKASSGNEALASILYHEFALIILDVQMPEMDGYEVAEILKSDQKTENIPIIFVTAIDRDSAKELKGYSKGAVDFMFKPLDEFILISKVKIFLEMYNMKSGLEHLVQERTVDLEKANDDLLKSNVRLKKIVETTKGLMNFVDMDSFAPTILKEFASHMSASGGSFYLVEDTRLRLLHSLDPGHAPDIIPFPLSETSVFNKVMKNARSICMNEFFDADLPESRPSDQKIVEASGWDGYENDSLLVFPFLDNSGKAAGLLSLHCSTDRVFSDQDKGIGSILASYSSETMRAVQSFEALQKSENQYRTLFEKTNDAIFILEKSTGRYLDANKATSTLIGKNLEELRMLTADQTTSEDKELWNSILRDLDKTMEIESMTYIRPDQTQRVARLSIMPLNAGTVIGIAKDVTHDLRVEMQLRQSQKMESIGTLAGGIAHDFNNVLFPIVGYSEMLLSDIPDDSPLKTGLDGIHTGAMRAKDLVSQILAFARQEKTESIRMKIQPIAKESLKLLRSTIPATIEIKHNIDPQCSSVEADPTQIHQIIINLATNAFHAMESAGGLLNVSLKEVTLNKNDLPDPDLEPGSFACIEIIDTGIGMKKDVLEKIFDPFFTTKEKFKGTGMGLSVVHGIVNSIGGAISVKSEYGKGTEFSVFLPVYKKEGEEPEQPPGPLKIEGGNEHILIVDDEKSIIEMESKMLGRLGYKVSAFDSSIKALETFKLNPEKFDLVISDMAMPGMAGDKLVVELINIRKDIPVILCTGFYNSKLEESLTASGIRGVLIKPIKMQDLSKKIREILD